MNAIQIRNQSMHHPNMHWRHNVHKHALEVYALEPTSTLKPQSGNNILVEINNTILAEINKTIEYSLAA